MRIIQIVHSLLYGDAIGNEVVALKKLLDSLGYKSEIFAMCLDDFYKKSGIKHISKSFTINKADVSILHVSGKFDFIYDFFNLPCKKVIIYHNITPPLFFQKYDIVQYDYCRNGLEEVRFLSDKVDYCLADSEFNKRNLVEIGYKCPIDVLPILIQKKDYMQEPSPAVIKKYSDGWTNIIFAGRVVPNKKQEDVIAAFGWYKKHINEKSRLFIVGRHAGKDDLYYRQLCSFVNGNGIEDVVFTGHVTFSEILAYYKCASLFLCMSEHEGFCVPIVEAMIFDLPIIVYDAAAVGETLGGGGLLVKDKDPVFVAKCMERILSDKQLQTRFRVAQEKRLDDFSYEKVSGQFIDFIRRAVAL